MECLDDNSFDTKHKHNGCVAFSFDSKLSFHRIVRGSAALLWHVPIMSYFIFEEIALVRLQFLTKLAFLAYGFLYFSVFGKFLIRGSKKNISLRHK